MNYIMKWVCTFFIFQFMFLGNFFNVDSLMSYWENNNATLVSCVTSVKILNASPKKQQLQAVSTSVNLQNQLGYERLLHQGQVGEDVYRLNLALKSLGYIISKPSYIFDSETRNAVIKLQKNNGLKSDGCVGKNTLYAINKNLSVKKLKIPDQTINVKKAPTQGYWITINKTSNTLTLLEGKKAIKKYHIATGKEASYTPVGQYKIASKVINPRWFDVAGGIPSNPLGFRWLGLNIKNGWIYGIHGTNKPNSIGTYASKGCIRMSNTDVESLFKILPKGTPVWIGSSNQLKQWGVQ